MQVNYGYKERVSYIALIDKIRSALESHCVGSLSEKKEDMYIRKWSVKVISSSVGLGFRVTNDILLQVLVLCWANCFIILVLKLWLD